MGAPALNISIEMFQVNCVCGGVYMISEDFRSRKYDIGGSWTCPYCASGWGYSGAGKLQVAQKELEAEKARKNAALARANELEVKLAAETETANQLKAKLATEVEMARLVKVRAKNGTCPCCTRTFKQFAAHMKNKHPEYSK